MSTVFRRKKSFMLKFQKQNRVINPQKGSDMYSTMINKKYGGQKSQLEKLTEAAVEIRKLEVAAVYDRLMRAQLTLIANSKKVRVICIPQDCL